MGTATTIERAATRKVKICSERMVGIVEKFEVAVAVAVEVS